MSERLTTTEPDDFDDMGRPLRYAPDDPDADTTEDAATESWPTGEHYSRMNVEAGNMGDVMYFSLPTFTILAKTQEELEAINADFSVLLSKYTDQLIVGTPHEASLILSLNQAAADLAVQNDVINTLRNKIYELTGSYDAAGDWGEEE